MKNKMWLFLRLFPFIIILLFCIARIGQSTEQFANLNNYMLNIYYISERFGFSPIQNTINNLITKNYFLVESTYMQGIISGLLSYELLINIIEIGINIIMYIPKVCKTAFERSKK